MAKMTLAVARRILKDSRYGKDKKKIAKEVIKKAKKRKPIKRKIKSSKTKSRVKTKSKTRSRLIRKRKRKGLPKSRPRRKARKNPLKSKIKFYDVANKRHVMVPRSECRLKRNRNPRGGDQLIANYKGRKLFTFVKKGFKL